MTLYQTIVAKLEAELTDSIHGLTDAGFVRNETLYKTIAIIKTIFEQGVDEEVVEKVAQSIQKSMPADDECAKAAINELLTTK